MSGPGRYRRKNRSEAQREIVFSQKSWTGLNEDTPASEIERGKVAYSENARFRGKYAQSRTGSKYLSATHMPGSGTYHALFFHETQKKWVVHRGTEIYISTDANAYLWNEVSGVTAFPDTDSKIRQFDDHALMYTTAGKYHIDVNLNITFKMNHDAPFNKLPDVGAAGLDYEYNYLITWCRILDSDGNAISGNRNRFDPNVRLLSESGTTRTYSLSSRDYSKFRSSSIIDASNTTAYSIQDSDPIASLSSSTDVITMTSVEFSESINTGSIVTITTTGNMANPLIASQQYYAIRYGGTGVQIKLAYTLNDALQGTAIDITDEGSGTFTIHMHADYSVPNGVTHYGIYRTLNISQNTDDGLDPVTGQGNNPELFGWVADIPIADTSFTDKIPDEALKMQIAAGSRLAKMRGFIPLPDGDLGAIGGSWNFVATKGEQTLHYSSVTKSTKQHVGFYQEGLQQINFGARINGMRISGDNLIVLLPNKTKLISLSSYQNQGLLEYVPVLNYVNDADETMGVVDINAISEIRKGALIARTSDHAIRIWDGTEWGDDLSHDRVNSIIRKMVVGSVGAYYDGSYYLWYRDDANKLYNDKCLRLDLDSSKGQGWDRCTDSFVFPPLNTGAFVIVDENDIQRLVVLDYQTNRLWWLDTFDSFTGSALSTSYGDKVTDDGICALGTKYFFDDMNNNSLDSGNLTAITSSQSTVAEQNNRLELRGDNEAS